MQAYKKFAISAALVASAGVVSEADYAPTLVADCKHQVAAVATPASWTMGPHMDTCGDFIANRPTVGAFTIYKHACAHDFVAMRTDVPNEQGLGALIKFRYLKEVSTTALPLMVILKDKDSSDFYSWCVNVKDASIGALCDDKSGAFDNLLPNQWHDMLVDFDKLSSKTGRSSMNAELVLNVYAEDAMEPVSLEVFSVKFVTERADWLQNCMTCQAGFHLMVSSGSALCYENECLCNGGVGARGAACGTHGSVVCTSCPAGSVHSPSAGGCVQATGCASGYVQNSAGGCVQATGCASGYVQNSAGGCVPGGSAYYTGASALPEKMTMTSSRMSMFAGSVVGSFFAVGAFVGARAWKSRQCAPEARFLEMQEEVEATA